MIDNTVENILTTKLEKYDMVTKRFQQFFDQEDLGALIDRKADIEIVRRMNDVKADVTEVDSI